LRTAKYKKLPAYWRSLLEDVKGATVLMGFISPATKFDEHAREAQKVIDTVEWTG